MINIDIFYGNDAEKNLARQMVTELEDRWEDFPEFGEVWLTHEDDA